ncbi:MAG: carbohydrate porin [Proteobacteria bacterium]|nr:carbohydrate porin [Pseudomonadota bacterium]
MVGAKLRLGLLSGLAASSVSMAANDQNEQKLDFHGYFRTTLGTSEKAEQPVFQAPGADSKYRLGNEADTVIELQFAYKFQPAVSAKSGSYTEGVFLLNNYQPVGKSSDIGLKEMNEFYVKFAKYIGDLDLWAGRRYFGRKDIHMNDHFWLNTSQGSHAGAGVENIPLGSAAMDLSLFNYEDQDVKSNKSADVKETLFSRMFDARVRDIKLGSDSSLSGWLGYMDRPKDEELGLEHRDGMGFAAWWTMNIGKSNNTLALIHRKGAALVQGGTNGRPVREDQGYDLKKASMFEVNDNYVLNMDSYALQFTALVREEQRGKEIDGKDVKEGDKISWKSIGVRPIYYVREGDNIALELGYDQVNNQLTGKNGSLFKQTLAYQFARLKDYYARPTIRLFVTNAGWSEAFKGDVASKVYADDTHGWSAGIQSEVWW